MEKIKPNQNEEYDALPFRVVRRLITASIIAGLLGGVIGTFGFVRYFPAVIPVDKRQVLLEENSAVIDVVKKVSPSVVSIRSSRAVVGPFGIGQSQQEGAGTGIILTADGLILTNKHVIADAGSFTVITSDGKEYEKAQVVATDPFNDIAFLRINASDLKAAELGNSGTLLVGQEVVAIGNALGQYENSASTGIVSGLARPVEAGGAGGAEQLTNLIQTDAAINPGNSGGPLVNLAGQVIGINTAVASNAQNIGFAIPINEAQAQIESVKHQGKIVRPYLGVRYIPVTREFAVQNNLPVQNGAYISGNAANPPVIPNSPAAKAGLRQGDILTKIGRDEINARNSLQSIVGKHKVGDKVTLTFIRDGKEQKLDVTLEEAPSGQ